MENLGVAVLRLPPPNSSVLSARSQTFEQVEVPIHVVADGWPQEILGVRSPSYMVELLKVRAKEEETKAEPPPCSCSGALLRDAPAPRGSTTTRCFKRGSICAAMLSVLVR